MSDTDVDVSFGAQLQGLQAGISQATSMLSGFGNGVIGGLTSSLKGLAAAGAAAFAVVEIGQFIAAMAKLGEETERTASMLGITTEEVGKLNAIAEITGTSAEAISAAMSRLQLQMTKDFSPAQNALAALNIQVETFRQLDIGRQMEVIAEKVSQFRDGGEKTALVMSLLGRSGAQMIPVLNQGAQGFRELNEIARRTGTLLSAETTKAFGAVDDAIDEMGLSLKGVGITIAEAFMPAAKAILTTLNSLIQAFNQSLKEGGALYPVLLSLGVAARGVAIAFAVIVATIQTVWEVAKSVVFSIAEAFISLGKVIYRTLTFDFAGAKQAFSDLGSALVARAQVTADNMKGIIDPMMQSLREAFSSDMGPAGSPAIKPPAPKPTEGADILSASMKRIDAEIAALQRGLDRKKTIFEGEASLFAITQDQKFALIMSATEKEYEAEKALLQKQLGLGGLKLSQKQDILNKIAELEDRHRNTQLQLDYQSIQEQQKRWSEVFDTIQGSFNANLRGLLAGTQKWSQVFRTILADLIIFAIQQIGKMVFAWVAGELAKTTATTTGVAARTAAETAGATAGLVPVFASIIKSIFAGAQQTFAGVFGFLSPVMGPAAAGPAAASSAAVAATAAAVPALETGAWNIANNTFALLHPNEMVVPAPFAPMVRSLFGAEGGSGGGSSGGDTINIHAVDAQSFEALLMRSGPAVMRSLKKQVRQGGK